MKNITCEVIRDLLPLYCDDICSPDSRRIVENHLADCPECSELLEQMKKECRIPCTEEQKQEEIVRDMASAWKKSTAKSFCRGVLLTVCVCLLLAGGYWALSRQILVPVPLDQLDAAVGNVTEEHVEIRLKMTDGKKVSSTAYRITEDGICYITLKRGVIAEKNGGGESWTMDCTISRTGISSGTSVPIKEIRCGTENSSILLWQAEAPGP